MAGVNIVRVPYKGTGPSLNAVIGGEVQVMFPDAGPVTPHEFAAKMKSEMAKWGKLIREAGIREE